MKPWMSAHHKAWPFSKHEAQALLKEGYGPCPYCPYWRKVDFPCAVAIAREREYENKSSL